MDLQRKLRSVRTLGGHHRILEEDIERHLRSKLAGEGRKKWGLGRQIKVDGGIAQITILADDYELASLLTADAVSELGLRTGDDIIALLKSSQIMILREPVWPLT
jgi:molybdopterin-binding protein